MYFKLTSALIAISISVYSSNVLADSFWGKLKNRVQDEVENVVSGKVARKASDKAGDAADTVLNPSLDNEEGQEQEETIQQQGNNEATPKAEPDAANNPMQGLGGMLSSLQQEVTIESIYEFDLSLSATQTYDGESSSMNQRYSESAFMLETEDDNQIIMDLTNKVIVMVDHKAKTKTGIPTQFMQQMAKMGGAMAQTNSAQPVGVASIKKTGKSKKIAGYQADQWVFENGDETGEVWISNKIDFDFIGFTKELMTLFGSEQSQMMFDFSALKGDYPRGLALESTSYSGGKVQSKYQVTKLSLKPANLDLSKYQTKSIMQGL